MWAHCPFLIQGPCITHKLTFVCTVDDWLTNVIFRFLILLLWTSLSLEILWFKCAVVGIIKIMDTSRSQLWFIVVFRFLSSSFFPFFPFLGDAALEDEVLRWDWVLWLVSCSTFGSTVAEVLDVFDNGSSFHDSTGPAANMHMKVSARVVWKGQWIFHVQHRLTLTNMLIFFTNGTFTFWCHWFWCIVKITINPRRLGCYYYNSIQENHTLLQSDMMIMEQGAKTYSDL